jgi:hypothetical protein
VGVDEGFSTKTKYAGREKLPEVANNESQKVREEVREETGFRRQETRSQERPAALIEGRSLNQPNANSLQLPGR